MPGQIVPSPRMRRAALAATLAVLPLAAAAPGPTGASPTSPAPRIAPPHAPGAVDAGYHTARATAWSQRISPSATQRLTVGLDQIRQFCASLPDELYRIDCLADGLDQWTRNIGEGSEYWEARTIVWQASRSLAAAASRYRDTARAPKQFASTNLPRRTDRPIAPIRPAAQAQANAAARSIVAEAETLLLRSAEQSQRRSVAFRSFATALGSSKVLLRSA